MIVAVSGPSGVGKTRLLEIARERCSFHRPIAWTTRRPRHGEVDGRDYHFIDRGEFRQRILRRRFIDWDFTIGNYYGYGMDCERFLWSDAAVLAVTARVAIRLAVRSPKVCSLFLDGDDVRMWARLEERGVERPELLLRELHRSEEREHSGLFQVRISDGDALSDEDAQELLLRLRTEYG